MTLRNWVWRWQRGSSQKGDRPSLKRFTGRELSVEKQGKVYIIGAGPGDPGLITVKGLRCLKEADVVIYDHLVSEEIIRQAKAPARFIYAGKKGGAHTLPQEEINRRLVEEAKQGHIVARVKGGDPFIFGRGGEEAETLAHAGIPFEVIPGVSSAVAVPAYAGIPLTHRGYTSTLAFVTGHEDPTKDESDVDWETLAGIGTLVFLMGVKNLRHITSNLMAYGKEGDTPAALIRWGTTEDQETLTGTLSDIARKAEDRKFSPPAILVVGDVVTLRKELNWFETKPLFGKGIVITRPEAQAEEFASLLYAEGARVIHFPTIKIVPPERLSRSRPGHRTAIPLPVDYLYERQRRELLFGPPSRTGQGYSGSRKISGFARSVRQQRPR